MKISFDADISEIKIAKNEVEQIVSQLKLAKSSIVDISNSLVKVAEAFKSTKTGNSSVVLESKILEI
jgi:hypothetical protein